MKSRAFAKHPAWWAETRLTSPTEALVRQTRSCYGHSVRRESDADGHADNDALVIRRGDACLAPDGRSEQRPYSPSRTFSARARVKPGVAAMSSTGASRTRATDPNLRSSARLRFGPMPGTASSAEAMPAFWRTLRW